MHPANTGTRQVSIYGGRIFTRISFQPKIDIICTYIIYWVGGPDGKLLFGSRSGRTYRVQRGRASWPRAKYFLARPDLSQPISILSYDHFFFTLTFFRWNEAASGPFAFLVGPYTFSRPYHFDAYGPHTDLFSYGFPRKLLAGPYGSYDKSWEYSAWAGKKKSLQVQVSS